MIPCLSQNPDIKNGLNAIFSAQKKPSLPALTNARKAVELALVPWLFREVAWNIKKGLEQRGEAGGWQHTTAIHLVAIFQSIAEEPTDGFEVPQSYYNRINRCLDIVIMPFQERFATGVFTVKTVLDLLVDDECLAPIPAESDFEKAFISLVEIMTSTDVDNGFVNNDKIWKSARKAAKKIIKELRRTENLFILPAGTISICDKED
jgi:uncharacterized protein (UPF0147 family)